MLGAADPLSVFLTYINFIHAFQLDELKGGLSGAAKTQAQAAAAFQAGAKSAAAVLAADINKGSGDAGMLDLAKEQVSRHTEVNI